MKLFSWSLGFVVRSQEHVNWSCLILIENLFENKCATLTLFIFLFRWEYSFSKSKQSSLDEVLICKNARGNLVPRALLIQVTYFWLRGHSTTTWTEFGHFLTPHLVHVVIECPLIPIIIVYFVASDVFFIGSTRDGILMSKH